MDIVPHYGARALTPVNAAFAAFTANQLYQAANNAYNTASEVIAGVNRVYKRARRIQEEINRATQAVRYEYSWSSLR
jgi:hypothetical protein